MLLPIFLSFTMTPNQLANYVANLNLAPLPSSPLPTPRRQSPPSVQQKRKELRERFKEAVTKVALLKKACARILPRSPSSVKKNLSDLLFNNF